MASLKKEKQETAVESTSTIFKEESYGGGEEEDGEDSPVFKQAAEADDNGDDSDDAMEEEELSSKGDVPEGDGGRGGGGGVSDRYYNYASQDYSQSETESNLNDGVRGEEEEEDGMDVSLEDDRLARGPFDEEDMDQGDDGKMSMSQEEEDGDMDKDSQEGEEIYKTRRTRSASVDERDGTGSGVANSTLSGSGIVNTNTSGAIAGKLGLKESQLMPREQPKEQDNLMDNKSSRSAAAAERELLGFREPTSATVPTTSFLDSLSEEQRRVRTRHLPDVAGFRRLHKSEIKRDLALAKKMLKAASKNGKKSASLDEEGTKDAEGDKMDVEGTGASEDESQSDVDSQNVVPKSLPGKGHMSDADLANIFENPHLSSIFSLPYNESPYICTDVEGKVGSANLPSLFSSPQVVESITAFNPPRPPESVGPKKMHRLNRWERNPQDVEVDLSNYRKTVDRTRQELHKAEDERERIEVVGQHLRAHFFTQLQCMSHEMNLLNDKYEEAQTQCIKAADLLTSKTRSRGTARGSNVMKDVLSVLKSRGEGASLDIPRGQSSALKSVCSLGVGGVGDDATSGLASGWLIPGDRVSTAYGEGTVAHAFGPTPLDTTQPPYSLTEATTEKDIAAKAHDSDPKKENPNVSVILPPRICVKLPFGMGYFSPKNVKTLDNPSCFSDDQLAKRWLAMVECSKGTGTCVDFAGVDNVDNGRTGIVSPSSSVGNRDHEDEIMGSGEMLTNVTFNGDGPVDNDKLLPYGSSLLPSSTNRGAGLEGMSIEQLEKNVSDMLEKSSGVLGARDHPSVPATYKQWEWDREELRTLQGEAQQLKNAVYRQRRIRLLNEHSAKSSQNRRDRFEFLLREMKSDLDMLKDRLKEELNELGIDESKARQMLSDYYLPDSEDIVESYGEKRKADDDDYEKSSRLKSDMEEGTSIAH